VFQAPTGTRDFYPAELNRLRYVQDAWRRTSVNHGFEEIDGPTFEHLDLYTVKSGEGIVSELFSFERFGGEKTFALRPEFTPTLARMYASKAASLPKPTKWFWMQNCYRAERPQRGRLREFCQWNCDIVGLPPFDANDPEGEARAKALVDRELLSCVIDMLRSIGLTHADVRVKFNSRELVTGRLRAIGVGEDREAKVLALIDASAKLEKAELRQRLEAAGVSAEAWDRLMAVPAVQDGVAVLEHGLDRLVGMLVDEMPDEDCDWLQYDPGIVRGLAYYTGMVFEVHEASGAERAIAGGGRYDKLIEMFGGPPTPAVGFGMGDVVLSLVLADKGKMPADAEVARKLGLNPDAIVVSNGSAEADGAVAGVVASLRRAGLHARRSSKKIGKAMQDAAKVGARFCVILEGADKATVKDMGTQGQEMCGVAELVGRVARQ
jgi:histidyl-tRNA synthetase